ncbi:hypothetical protein LEN26_012981 [Aphanomyces euteiches]|nr:hypothetical protein LEN26_019611 [Aphanomyces euteiches]KAH9115445.1 hypothetical protein LEN26_012981 [Aphanomyces euteiches]KAH9124862.1 hypothetical protein AeMF1_004437 [Aphanomyces euteiches]
MEGVPPVDFNEELLPTESFENNEAARSNGLQIATAVSAVRYSQGYKEFKVQTEDQEEWHWEPEVLLQPSELLANFEMKRLRLDRLEAMLDNELMPRPDDTQPNENTNNRDATGETDNANAGDVVNLPGWRGIIREERVV